MILHRAIFVTQAYSDGSYLKNTLTNYEKLRITGNYRIGEYNLEISSFLPDDEGHYRCNNINGSTAVHVDYYLETYRSPSNISVMNTSTDGLLEVNEGQSSLLSCTVESGNPAENMMWVHNDSILVFGGPKFLVYEFVPVVADHLQIYVCLANNSNREATVEYQVQIYVKELPYTTIQPVGSTVIEAAKGKDIVLKCEYTTNVKPYNLTWIFNNDTILSESSDAVTLNGTLNITNLSRKNTGTYRCNVYNTVGMGNAEVDVLVTYKPELASNGPFVFRTEIGKPAHISIPIRSFEKPTASWTLSSEESLQVGLLSDMFFIEGKIVPSTNHHFGKYGIRYNAYLYRTLLKEPLMTTDSHTENILYSSMYPVNSSEINDEVIDSAKDNSTVIFLIGGLTLFVALTLACAMWQYKAFLKGTTTMQTEIQISNGIALQNVKRSTSLDDIYEEICNENSDACPPSISGQKLEEDIDDKCLKIAGGSISAPYTNVYEIFG
ncbi:unnamed protein product [Mytilus coruscus]|uniref:Ig-like domain-containing protein n=1 Tax=Mytilus coruscus TaxID=42192 RepID=A0A6J8CQD5_MYTCO|nr:unnamed protein product [Mytilus coruscus]